MDIFIHSFVLLFVIVDPIGTAAVFSALARGLDQKASARIALRAVAIGITLLLLFGLGGNYLLQQLGISLGAFRVAGGMLLFVTAFRMLMGFHDPDTLQSERSTYKDRSDIAVFPIAIPLLAGPGCLTAVMLSMTATHVPLDKAFVALAVVVVQLIALACMLMADRLVRLFGPSGSSLLARIMGVLMAAMAVQFIADGLKMLASA
jgi:multiple antibiotic resistance protein